MTTKNLYQYFKRDRQSSLPNNISLSTIDNVNKEVKTIASVQSDEILKTRGEYIKLTAKDWATIGEYAAKNEIAAASCHFRQNEQFSNLKETSVQGWKNTYRKEVLIQSNKKHGPVEIEELPQKRTVVPTFFTPTA